MAFTIRRCLARTISTSTDQMEAPRQHDHGETVWILRFPPLGCSDEVFQWSRVTCSARNFQALALVYEKKLCVEEQRKSGLLQVVVQVSTEDLNHLSDVVSSCLPRTEKTSELSSAAARESTVIFCVVNPKRGHSNPVDAMKMWGASLDEKWNHLPRLQNTMIVVLDHKTFKALAELHAEVRILEEPKGVLKDSVGRLLWQPIVYSASLTSVWRHLEEQLIEVMEAVPSSSASEVLLEVEEVMVEFMHIQNLPYGLEVMLLLEQWATRHGVAAVKDDVHGSERLLATWLYAGKWEPSAFLNFFCSLPNTLLAQKLPLWKTRARSQDWRCAAQWLLLLRVAPGGATWSAEQMEGWNSVLDGLLSVEEKCGAREMQRELSKISWMHLAPVVEWTQTLLLRVVTSSELRRLLVLLWNDQTEEQLRSQLHILIPFAIERFDSSWRMLDASKFKMLNEIVLPAATRRVRSKEQTIDNFKGWLSKVQLDSETLSKLVDARLEMVAQQPGASSASTVVKELQLFKWIVVQRDGRRFSGASFQRLLSKYLITPALEEEQEAGASDGILWRAKRVRAMEETKEVLVNCFSVLPCLEDVECHVAAQLGNRLKNVLRDHFLDITEACFTEVGNVALEFGDKEGKEPPVSPDAEEHLRRAAALIELFSGAMADHTPADLPSLSFTTSGRRRRSPTTHSRTSNPHHRGDKDEAICQFQAHFAKGFYFKAWVVVSNHYQLEAFLTDARFLLELLQLEVLFRSKPYGEEKNDEPLPFLMLWDLLLAWRDQCFPHSPMNLFSLEEVEVGVLRTLPPHLSARLNTLRQRGILVPSAEECEEARYALTRTKDDMRRLKKLVSYASPSVVQAFWEMSPTLHEAYERALKDPTIRWVEWMDGEHWRSAKRLRDLNAFLVHRFDQQVLQMLVSTNASERNSLLSQRMEFYCALREEEADVEGCGMGKSTDEILQSLAECAAAAYQDCLTFIQEFSAGDATIQRVKERVKDCLEQDTSMSFLFADMKGMWAVHCLSDPSAKPMAEPLEIWTRAKKHYSMIQKVKFLLAEEKSEEPSSSSLRKFGFMCVTPHLNADETQVTEDIQLWSSFEDCHFNALSDMYAAIHQNFFPLFPELEMIRIAEVLSERLGNLGHLWEYIASQSDVFVTSYDTPTRLVTEAFQQKIAELLPHAQGIREVALVQLGKYGPWVAGFVRVREKESFAALCEELRSTPSFFEPLSAAKTDEEVQCFLEAVQRANDDMPILERILTCFFDPLDGLLVECADIDAGFICLYNLDAESVKILYASKEEGLKEKNDREVKEFVGLLRLALRYNEEEFEDFGDLERNVGSLHHHIPLLRELQSACALGFMNALLLSEYGEIPAVVQQTETYQKTRHISSEDIHRLEERTVFASKPVLMGSKEVRHFAELLEKEDYHSASLFLGHFYVLKTGAEWNGAILKEKLHRVKELSTVAQQSWNVLLPVLLKECNASAPLVNRRTPTLRSETGQPELHQKRCRRYACVDEKDVMIALRIIYESNPPYFFELLWCDGSTTAAAVREFVKRSEVFPKFEFTVVHLELLSGVAQRELLHLVLQLPQRSTCMENATDVVHTTPCNLNLIDCADVLTESTFTAFAIRTEILPTSPSFTPFKGNITWFTGPSGCGKTYQLRKKIDELQQDGQCTAPVCHLIVSECFTIGDAVTRLATWKNALATLEGTPMTTATAAPSKTKEDRRLVIAIRFSVGEYMHSEHDQWMHLFRSFNMMVYMLFYMRGLQDPTSGWAFRLPHSADHVEYLVELPPDDFLKGHSITDFFPLTARAGPEVLISQCASSVFDMQEEEVQPIAQWIEVMGDPLGRMPERAGAHLLVLMDKSARTLEEEYHLPPHDVGDTTEAESRRAARHPYAGSKQEVSTLVINDVCRKLAEEATNELVNAGRGGEGKCHLAASGMVVSSEGSQSTLVSLWEMERITGGWNRNLQDERRENPACSRQRVNLWHSIVEGMKKLDPYTVQSDERISFRSIIVVATDGDSESTHLDEWRREFWKRPHLAILFIDVGMTKETRTFIEEECAPRGSVCGAHLPSIMGALYELRALTLADKATYQEGRLDSVTKYWKPEWSFSQKKMWIKYMRRHCAALRKTDPTLLRNNGLMHEIFNSILTRTEHTVKLEPAKNVEHWFSRLVSLPYSGFGKKDSADREYYSWSVIQGDEGNATVREIIKARAKELIAYGMTLPVSEDLEDPEVLETFLAMAVGAPVRDSKLKLSATGEEYNFPVGSFSALHVDPYFILNVDFLLKMIQMNELIDCNISFIIQGETGVSKTKLTKMLFAAKNWRVCPSSVCAALSSEEELEDSEEVALPSILFRRRKGKTEEGMVLEKWSELRSWLRVSGSYGRWSTQLHEVQWSVQDALQTPSTARKLWHGIVELLREDPSLIPPPQLELSEAFPSKPEETLFRTMEWLCGISSSDRMVDKGTWMFYPVNVDGTLTQREIEKTVRGAHERISRIKEMADRFPSFTTHRNAKVCVFLDEFNTSSCVGVLKEILQDHSLNGEALHSDLVVIAACNPRRDRLVQTFDRDSSAHTNQLAWSSGHYVVRDTPKVLREFTWEYEALTHQQEVDFIKRRLRREQLNIRIQEQNTMVQVIGACQNWVRNMAIQSNEKWKLEEDGEGRRTALTKEEKEECILRGSSAVSIRDIVRFFSLFGYFLQLGTAMHRMYFRDSLQNPPWREVLLALGLTYYTRLDTEGRLKFDTQFDHVFPHVTMWGTPRAQLEASMGFVCEEMDVNDTVLTPGIQENILAILVHLDAKVPLIIHGPPGTSKTLAVNLVVENARGEYSKSALENMNRLIPTHYQCSKQTTGRDITRGLERAKSMTKQFMDLELGCESFFFMDEAGIPEEKRESLKVLHFHLEHNESQPVEIGFIALTNNALDAAKSNRCSVVTRALYNKADLVLLARGCLCFKEEWGTLQTKMRFRMEKVDQDKGSFVALQDVVDLLCSRFYVLAQESKEMLQRSDSAGFFGTRGFMHLWKLLGRLTRTAALEGGEDAMAPPVAYFTFSLLAHAIQRNFNGGTRRATVEIIRFLTQDFEDTEAVLSQPENRLLTWLTSLTEREIHGVPTSRYHLLTHPSGDDGIPREVEGLLREMAQEARQHLAHHEKPSEVFSGDFTATKPFTARRRAVPLGDVTRLRLSPFSHSSDEELRIMGDIKWNAAKGNTLCLSNANKIKERLYDLLNQRFKKASSQERTALITTITEGSFSITAVVDPMTWIIIFAPSDLDTASEAFLDRLEKYRILFLDLLDFYVQQRDLRYEQLCLRESTLPVEHQDFPPSLEALLWPFVVRFVPHLVLSMEAFVSNIGYNVFYGITPKEGVNSAVWTLLRRWESAEEVVWSVGKLCAEQAHEKRFLERERRTNGRGPERETTENAAPPFISTVEWGQVPRDGREIRLWLSHLSNPSLIFRVLLQAAQQEIVRMLFEQALPERLLPVLPPALTRMYLRDAEGFSWNPSPSTSRNRSCGRAENQRGPARPGFREKASGTVEMDDVELEVIMTRVISPELLHQTERVGGFQVLQTKVMIQDEERFSLELNRAWDAWAFGGSGTPHTVAPCVEKEAANDREGLLILMSSQSSSMWNLLNFVRQRVEGKLQWERGGSGELPVSQGVSPRRETALKGRIVIVAQVSLADLMSSDGYGASFSRTWRRRFVDAVGEPSVFPLLRLGYCDWGLELRSPVRDLGFQPEDCRLLFERSMTRFEGRWWCTLGGSRRDSPQAKRSAAVLLPVKDLLELLNVPVSSADPSETVGTMLLDVFLTIHSRSLFCGATEESAESEERQAEKSQNIIKDTVKLQMMHATPCLSRSLYGHVMREWTQIVATFLRGLVPIFFHMREDLVKKEWYISARGASEEHFAWCLRFVLKVVSSVFRKDESLSMGARAETIRLQDAFDKEPIPFFDTIHKCMKRVTGDVFDQLQPVNLATRWTDVEPMFVEAFMSFLEDSSMIPFEAGLVKSFLEEAEGKARVTSLYLRHFLAAEGYTRQSGVRYAQEFFAQQLGNTSHPVLVMYLCRQSWDEKLNELMRLRRVLRRTPLEIDPLSAKDAVSSLYTELELLLSSKHEKGEQQIRLLRDWSCLASRVHVDEAVLSTASFPSEGRRRGDDDETTTKKSISIVVMVRLIQMTTNALFSRLDSGHEGGGQRRQMGLSMESQRSALVSAAEYFQKCFELLHQKTPECYLLFQANPTLAPHPLRSLACIPGEDVVREFGDAVTTVEKPEWDSGFPAMVGRLLDFNAFDVLDFSSVDLFFAKLKKMEVRITNLFVHLFGPPRVFLPVWLRTGTQGWKQGVCCEAELLFGLLWQWRVHWLDPERHTLNAALEDVSRSCNQQSGVLGPCRLALDRVILIQTIARDVSRLLNGETVAHCDVRMEALHLNITEEEDYRLWTHLLAQELAARQITGKDLEHVCGLPTVLEDPVLCGVLSDAAGPLRFVSGGHGASCPAPSEVPRPLVVCDHLFALGRREFQKEMKAVELLTRMWVLPELLKMYQWILESAHWNQEKENLVFMATYEDTSRWRLIVAGLRDISEVCGVPLEPLDMDEILPDELLSFVGSETPGKLERLASALVDAYHTHVAKPFQQDTGEWAPSNLSDAVQNFLGGNEVLRRWWKINARQFSVDVQNSAPEVVRGQARLFEVHSPVAMALSPLNSTDAWMDGGKVRPEVRERVQRDLQDLLYAQNIQSIPPHLWHMERAVRSRAVSLTAHDLDIRLLLPSHSSVGVRGDPETGLSEVLRDYFLSILHTLSHESLLLLSSLLRQMLRDELEMRNRLEEENFEDLGLGGNGDAGAAELLLEDEVLKFVYGDGESPTTWLSRFLSLPEEECSKLLHCPARCKPQIVEFVKEQISSAAHLFADCPLELKRRRWPAAVREQLRSVLQPFHPSFPVFVHFLITETEEIKRYADDPTASLIPVLARTFSSTEALFHRFPLLRKLSECVNSSDPHQEETLLDVLTVEHYVSLRLLLQEMLSHALQSSVGRVKAWQWGGLTREKADRLCHALLAAQREPWGVRADSCWAEIRVQLFETEEEEEEERSDESPRPKNLGDLRVELRACLGNFRGSAVPRIRELMALLSDSRDFPSNPLMVQAQERLRVYAFEAANATMALEGIMKKEVLDTEELRAQLEVVQGDLEVHGRAAREGRALLQTVLSGPADLALPAVEPVLIDANTRKALFHVLRSPFQVMTVNTDDTKEPGEWASP